MAEMNTRMGNGQSEDAPVVQYVQQLLEQAVAIQASDLHFEPYEHHYRVRMRVDGQLREMATPPMALKDRLASRIKVLSRLDIAEKRLPQDGRMKLLLPSGREIDLRVSTLPTLFGEKLVIRVLDSQQVQLDLRQLGYEPEDLNRLMDAVRMPHGMVLVTGPTGSGKSTTLAALLHHLNVTQPLHILTLEDPIEFEHQSARSLVQQRNVPGHCASFDTALRAALRQDPDVIFLGEIRDQETAQIATRAAMTGHLVLSTLHTNDAATTPGRLIDMGIPPYLIASTLLGVLSQRLLRVICTYCKEPYTPNDDESAWLKHHVKEPVAAGSLAHGKGCTRCNGFGYSGRTGVHEILEMTPPLARALRSGDLSEFEREAADFMGNTTIEHRVIALMLAGETTVAEAMKVVSWAED